MDRELGYKDANAAEGPREDREGRLERFKTDFCDVEDNNQGLNAICGGASAPTTTRNKDVSYMRTVELPMTLDVDFTDGTPPSDDERSVIALANNLYSHDVFARPSSSALDVLENQSDYMDARALTAKRSVAEHSFNTIVGLKSAGSTAAAQTGVFMNNILEQLGVSDAEASAMLGDRPSYYAQMEILTQKIYQDPEFYTNLYDKPANVMRKDVAMQAINLMLDRDMYNSVLRAEGLLSLLLEMEVSSYQEEVANRSAGVDAKGKEN